MPEGATPAIEELARRLMGEPNAEKSTATKLYFGPDAVIKVDTEFARWFDYIQEIGGGAEQLAEHVASVSDDTRYFWLMLRSPKKSNGSSADHAGDLVTIAQTAEPGSAPGERTQMPAPDDSERELIGLLISRSTQPGLIDAVLEEVRASDFSFFLHADIFDVFWDAADKGYELKLPVLIAALGGETGRPKVADLTLSQYIARVVAESYVPDNDEDAVLIARNWARDVRQAAEIARGELDDGALDEVPDKPAQPWESKLGAVFWENMHRPRPRYEWTIKGIIPRRQTVLIYGARQSGKSFLVFDMAMSIARGLEYFGRKVKSGLVVYCAVEAQEGFVDVRMPAYELAHGMAKGERIPFVCITKPFNLFRDDAGVTMLMEELRGIAAHFSLPIEVVIIDTYNRATSGADEISGRDVAIIIDRIDRVRHEFKCGLWLVHHVNAGGTMRGHTSLGDNFETMIKVARTGEPIFDQNKREVRSAGLDKQREGADGVSWDFVLKQVVLGTDEDGEDITSCAVEAPSTGELFTAPAVGEPKKRIDPGFEIRSDRLRLAFSGLQKALMTKGGQAPRESGLPRDLWAVHRDHWADAMREIGAYAGDDPGKRADSIKKAIQFAMGKLQGAEFRLIGVNYPWVWRTDRKVAGYPPAPVLKPIDDELLPWDQS